MSTAEDNGSTSCVQATDVYASYGEGELKVQVLEGAAFEIRRGGITAITGPSGSGKTTLLSLIGGLDRPEQGSLLVEGTDLTKLSRRALARFRRERCGFVFQSFNLLPTLTCRENVEAGLEPLGLPRGEIRKRAEKALTDVGLSDKLLRFPHELSGGEQQRVAVARACAKRPLLLLADEPTGNLDEEAGARVLDLLFNDPSDDHADSTVIVVTHDPVVADRADTVLVVRAHRVEVARSP